MCLNIGRDFWCAYQGRWVAKSEFNSVEAAYHESKNGTPYMAAGWGACKCLTCPKINKSDCEKCDNPKKLRAEQEDNVIGYLLRVRSLIPPFGDPRSRCSYCMAQYKMNGKLR